MPHDVDLAEVQVFHDGIEVNGGVSERDGFEVSHACRPGNGW
jgi:hypothetical protein